MRPLGGTKGLRPKVAGALFAGKFDFGVKVAAAHRAGAGGGEHAKGHDAQPFGAGGSGACGTDTAAVLAGFFVNRLQVQRGFGKTDHAAQGGAKKMKG